MKKPKIIYLTSWYEERDLPRHEELRKCIHNVCKMGEVDEVWVICEGGSRSFMSLYSKISIKIFSNVSVKKIDAIKRPTYNDFFKIANNVSKYGDILIIANTDIFPSHGVREKIESMKQNDCYALSRYDVKKNHMEHEIFDRCDSQDVWVFKAPIRNIEGDFFLGKLGCDNAIAERIHNQGYNIQNPSKSIQFNHLHNSGVRGYDLNIKVPKPYLLIAPHFLGEEPSYRFINS